jgi:hypothetical protein
MARPKPRESSESARGRSGHVQHRHGSDGKVARDLKEFELGVTARRFTLEDATTIIQRFITEESRNAVMILWDDLNVIRYGDDDATADKSFDVACKLAEAIVASALAEVKPIMADALLRHGNAVLGFDPLPDGMPVYVLGDSLSYEVPSWAIFPKDRDANEEEHAAGAKRCRLNLLWFMRNPQPDYDLATVAELLAVEPSTVVETMQAYQFVPNDRERFDRFDVAEVMHAREGDEEDYAWVILQGAHDPALAVNDVPDAQLAAIRAFFVEPKERYAPADVRPIFGKYMSDDNITGDHGMFGGEEFVTHDLVEAFMRSYISHVVIGRALVGLGATPYDLKTITVTLPAWIVDGLQELAASRGDTVSDSLALEIANLEGGVGKDMDAFVLSKSPEDVTLPARDGRSILARAIAQQKYPDDLPAIATGRMLRDGVTTHTFSRDMTRTPDAGDEILINIVGEGNRGQFYTVDAIAEDGTIQIDPRISKEVEGFAPIARDQVTPEDLMSGRISYRGVVSGFAKIVAVTGDLDEPAPAPKVRKVAKRTKKATTKRAPAKKTRRS